MSTAVHRSRCRPQLRHIQRPVDEGVAAVGGVVEVDCDLGESIDAHPTIVFAALAVTRCVEAATGRSIKSSRTTTRGRTVQIHVRRNTVTAEGRRYLGLDVLARAQAVDINAAEQEVTEPAIQAITA
jgi:hypothetical protein